MIKYILLIFQILIMNQFRVDSPNFPALLYITSTLFTLEVLWFIMFFLVAGRNKEYEDILEKFIIITIILLLFINLFYIF